MVCVLALAFMVEWRVSRTLTERLSSDMVAALDNLSRKYDVMASRLGGIGASLAAAQETLLAQNAAYSRIENVLAEGPAATGIAGTTSVASAPPPTAPQGVTFEVRDLEGLPPLPEDLRPESFLDDERLGDLFVKYRIDPERRLKGLDLAKALNILAETRAKVDVLHSRIQVDTREAAERLRQRGDYVDYARGQKYHSEPGVVTFGEQLQDGGMRIFYLYEEEFPEIYAMREEKRVAPEIGIRRLLELINGKGNVAMQKEDG
jgi:hypothetical protein